MNLSQNLLNNWMKENDGLARINLGSSEVSPFSPGELWELLGVSQEEFDKILLEKTEPTHGNLALKKSIAERWGKGKPDEVMLSGGANEILYSIMNSLLREGEEILFMNTVCPTLSLLPKIKGCKIKHWKMNSEKHFIPDLEQLKEMITPKTRVVFIHFPQNPTGVSFSAKQQEELIRMLSRSGAYLVWSVALEAMMEGLPLTDLRSEYDKVISVGSLSKTYGFSGLKIGWCFAPPEIFALCTQICNYAAFSLFPLQERLARIVLEKGNRLVQHKREEVRRNFRYLEQWMLDHQKWVEWIRPYGPVGCLIKLHGMIETELFCTTLIREQGVLLIPGNCLGYHECVLLGFGCPPTEFEEGLRLISQHLQFYDTGLKQAA